MESYLIGDTDYYRLDDIISHCPDFNEGCSSIAKIIEKHSLSANNYIYARHTPNEWVKSKGNSKKFDKLFIDKVWFDDKSSEITLELSIIYFYVLGTVADIRDKHDIDLLISDTDYVGVYGISDNLYGTTSMYEKEYGSQVELLASEIIDPSYVSQVNVSLNNYFANRYSQIEVNPEIVLVIINSSKFDAVKSHYTSIGLTHCGTVHKYATMAKDLAHSYEIKLTVEKYEKDLLQKENKFLKQKIDLMLSKK